MKKSSLPLVAAALVLTVTAHAQERTAGQAYAAQVNWSALKSGIDQVSAQNKALAASMAVLQDSMDKLDAKVGAIAACGAQGKVWNGKNCTNTTGATPQAQVATFTVPTHCTRACGVANPASNNYCRSKGYDALVSSQTSTASTTMWSGQSGIPETFVTAYRITCIRVR